MTNDGHPTPKSPPAPGAHLIPPGENDELSPLQEEIDSLRLALQRLVKSFSNTETLKACPHSCGGLS